MIKFILAVIAIIFVSGCGDTINNTNTVPQEKLSIKSVTYNLYSSVSNTTVPQKWIAASIYYSGDAKDAGVFIQTVSNGQLISTQAESQIILLPDKQINLFPRVGLNTTQDMQLYFFMIDAHGDSTNIVLGTKY